MRSLVLAAIGAFMLVGCETVPVEVNMQPSAFQTAVSRATSAWHPYAGIEDLNTMLETQTLSSAQRARVLYERGRIRTENAIELPNGIQDLQQATTLQATIVPEEGVAPMQPIPDTSSMIRIAEAKLQLSRARLAGLQTLPQWFDDKVAVSEVAEAAERYRTSGLAPDPFDAGLLEAAGYLCRNDGAGAGKWQLGENTSHLSDLDWCPAPTAAPAPTPQASS